MKPLGFLLRGEKYLNSECLYLLKEVDLIYLDMIYLCLWGVADLKNS